MCNPVIGPYLARSLTCDHDPIERKQAALGLWVNATAKASSANDAQRLLAYSSAVQTTDVPSATPATHTGALSQAHGQKKR